jgi:hypothetical protein
MVKVTASNAVIFGVVVGILIFLLSAIFLHSPTSCSSKAPEDYAIYIEAINKRLLESETINIKNVLVINKITSILKQHLKLLEDNEIKELIRGAEEEAIRLALVLDQYPAPPMPYFDFHEYRDDPSKLADTVNDIFSSTDDRKYESPQDDDEGYKMDDEHVAKYGDTPPLSDEEKRKTCTEWKDKYEVKVGMSWGKLPDSLQQKWIRNSCDYFLETLTKK